MQRPATLDDLDALVTLENRCFETDRLSRRSFRYMLTKARAAIIVDAQDGRVRGYVLVLFSQGTSLARLYSIAVDSPWQGQGIAGSLVLAAEEVAKQHACVSMRLEVRKDNLASLTLFRQHGYKPFKEVLDYYEDHMDALRFEKRLAPHLKLELVRVPYYEQTLDFTCGPACLMMAMKALDANMLLNRKLELRLWRETTTIFMTAGHGGCGPYGLALAAYQRGFDLEVYVNEKNVFLVDSVRSPEKKEVMRLVQEDFMDQISHLPIGVHYGTLTVDTLQQKFETGGIPVVLISSYRIYGERFPHWIVVTGFDEHYVYSHDPFVDYAAGESVADSVNMPIPRQEFQRMARYGKSGQRAVLILRRTATAATRSPTPSMV
jgi:ribosomal protein S18 acetylase RimI-like enzyme